MMTETEILNLIADRIRVLRDSCNSTHIEHNIGVLRGCLWILSNRDPGTRVDSTDLVLGALPPGHLVQKLTTLLDQDQDEDCAQSDCLNDIDEANGGMTAKRVMYTSPIEVIDENNWKLVGMEVYACRDAGGNRGWSVQDRTTRNDTRWIMEDIHDEDELITLLMQVYRKRSAVR